MASRTTAGSSWWFSASSRRLQADLERVAPKTPTSSPIVMVASTPARRDHLALIESACTPPATGCTAAAQRGEQKRSTVQWRSALSTALWSAIVRAMTAGGANAGAEGALTMYAVPGEKRKQSLRKILPWKPFRTLFLPSSWPAPLQHDPVSPARRLTCCPFA